VIDAAVWSGMLAGRDFQIATNMTDSASDDPDPLFAGNFACGAVNNLSDYCNKGMDAEINAASQELDPKRRLQLVHEIDRKLQLNAARPMLGQALDFMMYWPHVRNLIPHNDLYNYGRMQNVWMDR
jgi:ABC-type transport system substrate-binding protein